MGKFRVLLCMTLLVLLLVGMSVPATAYSGESSTVYAMYINGQQVGIVKFPARALSIYDSIERRQREEYKEDVFIDTDIYFKGINVVENRVTGEEFLVEAIEDAIDIRIDSYAINIDGTSVCYVKTLEEAQKVIDDIKAPYIEEIEKREGSHLEDVTFKQVIDFEHQVTSTNSVKGSKEAMDVILRGNDEFREYEVQEGDSLWLIAHQNNINVVDLEQANPHLQDEIIQPGDIISIGKQNKLLTVMTKEKVRYSREIPFETETKDDNRLEKGKTKVIQEGEKGVKDIVDLVTREDGHEVNRETVEEVAVKEPVKHIVANGTYVKPKPAPRPAPKPSQNTSSNKSSSTPSNTSNDTTADRGTVSGSASSVVELAKQFKGYSYVFRTAGPNTFDCSGFIKYLYGRFGVTLPHSSKSLRSVGNAISRENLKPGDILCFSGHVGLYIGNNQFIHASNKKTGVIISNLGSYSKPLITARRIFK